MVLIKLIILNKGCLAKCATCSNGTTCTTCKEVHLDVATNCACSY